MRRRLTMSVVLLVCLGLLVGPAVSAASTTQTKTMVSGQGVPGDRDGATKVSADGGTTWAPAYIITPLCCYAAPLTGTNWISPNATGLSPTAFGTYVFQTHFNLPSTFIDPTLSVSLLADNVASVSVNGNPVGSQSSLGCPSDCPVDNFLLVSVISDSDSTHFKAGKNTLTIVVEDYGVLVGLDYLATITYSN